MFSPAIRLMLKLSELYRPIALKTHTVSKTNFNAFVKRFNVDLVFIQKARVYLKSGKQSCYTLIILMEINVHSFLSSTRLSPNQLLLKTTVTLGLPYK